MWALNIEINIKSGAYEVGRNRTKLFHMLICVGCRDIWGKMGKRCFVDAGEKKIAEKFLVRETAQGPFCWGSSLLHEILTALWDITWEFLINTMRWGGRGRREEGEQRENGVALCPQLCGGFKSRHFWELPGFKSGVAGQYHHIENCLWGCGGGGRCKMVNFNRMAGGKGRWEVTGEMGQSDYEGDC